MSHTFSVIKIWKYWDFDSILLVISQIGLLPFENQIECAGIILDLIYLTSALLGQRNFERSFTSSKIWLIDSLVMLVYLKVK